MKPRCPRCGIRFEREDGWWLGAYVINFAVTEAAVAIYLGTYIAIRANGGNVGAEFLALAAATVVVVPLLFFPFSRTIWASIDLLLHPIEVEEFLDAHAAQRDVQEQ